jgi:hypothetical protein
MPRIGTVGPRDNHHCNQTTFLAPRLKTTPGTNASAAQVYAKGAEIVTTGHQ